MKRSSILFGLCLAILLAVPASVFAALPGVHFFDCKLCHLSGYTATQMSGQHICLQCHDNMSSDTALSPNPPVTIDGHTEGRFSPGDASAAFGNNAAPNKQTSHNWAAPDTQPSAGAQAPATSYQGFYSRYRASHGKVTCSRCHNPHGEATSVPPAVTNNPKLLIRDSANGNLPMDPETMCRACHVAYAAQDAGNHGLVGHPVTSGTYASVIASQPTKYKTEAQVNAAAGASKAELIGGKVTCLSCHNIHFADSDSTTADGMANRTGLNAGDGKLLKGDGAQFVNDPVRSQSFCNTCHTYATGFHGTGPSAVGCLGCHGGHNNTNGQPTYYMLNSAYTTRPTNAAERAALWGGTVPGVQDGFCEGCHGNIEANFGGSLQDHTGGFTDCEVCHLTHTQGSFSQPIGCDTCHGFPPRTATGGGPSATGYAIDPVKGYNYSVPASNGGITYRNEATTGHATHAYKAGAGNYAYACDQCHQGNTHDDQVGFNPTFQDVFNNTTGLLAVSQGFAPTYNKPAATCATVYCHSDGRSARAGGAVAKTVPNWAGGSTTCTSCHTTGTTGTATVHNTHLALAGLSVTCDTCHTLTSADGTTLKATATGDGGVHVDGTVTVDGAFNTFVPAAFNTPTGTCAVYCHTNGTTYKVQPDWDDVNTGDCGDCHAVTAGNGLSGAHDRHLSLGFACNACHTHDGSAFGGDHIDGNGLTDHDLKVNACGVCHGATVGVTAGPDRYPTWTAPLSVDCETCHTGSVIATVNSFAAPAMNSAATTGHNRPTASGAYAVSGNVAANQLCTGCHDASAPGHYDGDLVDDRLLPAAATCTTSCHGVGGSAVKDGIVTHQSKNCNVCHNPHGTANIFMVNATSAGNYSGTVAFLARTGADSYDEDDGAAGGAGEVNADDLCATCHTVAGGTTHNNANNSAVTHNQGTDCFGCHKAHTDPVPFAAGAGNACDACHGFPPNTAAHALHAPDSFALDGAGSVLDTADRTACAYCHTGANLYTYDTSADQASGTAGRMNHAAGEATQDATLLASVGYSATNLNCATACHASTLADGAWNDTALNCTACHGNPPADGGGAGTAHAKHIAAGQTCATCHVSLPTDTAHISVKTGATELARVQNAAQALADEANVVVTTWNDTNNTCGNAACHAPSADGKLADWDTSTSSCILCHRNDVASGQPMQTGGHTTHMNNAAVIGDNIACTSCHPSVAGNMAHLNGTVNVSAGLNYSGEVAVPNTAYGTCNSANCHISTYGKGQPIQIEQTDLWGFDDPDDCGICHKAPSINGDHDAHWSAGRISRGMSCVSCHADTVLSNLTIKPGGKHLDGSMTDVAFSGNYDGSAISASYNAVPDPSSCSANCHATGNPKVWEPATSCESCHGDLSYVGATHTRHIDIAGGIELDVSECSICHGDVSGYTLIEAGTHQDGTIDLAVGISNTTCAAACHASTAGVDGFWGDSNGLGCDACHGNPPAGDNHSKHIAAGLTCGSCHGTVDAAGTHPLTHNHAKDIGAPGTNNGEMLLTRGKDHLNPTGLEIAVNDAAYNAGGGSTWLNSAVTDDGGNACSNALCHDPSNVARMADWDEDVASCTLCHGDNASGLDITTGSHDNHLHADAKFGITVTCNRCHPDNTGNTKHFMSGGVPNGQVKFGGTVITTQYQGEVNVPNSGYGTCTTNNCHNNGKGGAPVTAFTWGTPVVTDCQFCHDDPPFSGRHQTHLGTTVNYGPYAGVASTNCGDCHNANNDLTMTGRATHINGVINFDDGNSVSTGGIVANGTVASCNNCHGAGLAGNINSSLAKAEWNNATRLACESCHGNYGGANSKADNSGITAPVRAGNGYATSGHGKAGVSKGCNECHDSTVTHISAALGDANRLDTMTKDATTYNYGVLGERNGWCGACHSTTMYGHFANTQTAGNTSDDGLYCNICHDPHGQNGGQDAMVASVINGNTVTGFTDRSDRASYGNASFTGVCQVCHDGAEVPHFNRSTDESATHNSGNCLTCHKHTDNPAFQASGCSGCHGGGYPVFANNYWPDSSNARAENTAGRHQKHMQRLALATYNETLDQLLTDTGNGTTDAKQKTLCAYCHNAPGTDADHSLTLPAEVNSMANLWNGNLDNAVWAAGVNSGNCSNVNCHNNQTTPAGYGWYGGNASACTMCHVAGNADDLVNNNIHPNSGLHKVVNTSTVQSHNHTLPGGCTSCHLSTQPSTHIDGSAVADGAANTDRFLNDGTLGTNAFDFIDGPVNEASCGSTVGLISGCHTDRGNWRRLWSKQADSTDTALGSPRCNVCHGQPTGGSSLGWRDGYSPAYAMSSSTDATIGHNRVNINDTSKHSNCEFCHVAPAGPYNTYVYATMHENGLVETNNGAGVGYNSVNGSCTNFCHPSGSTKTMAGSTIWNNNPLLGASPTCAECHDELGGGLKPPYDTTIPGFGGGAHDKHVNGAATVYADTTNKSTAAVYNYGCANCHPNDILHHNDGRIDLSLNSSHGGPLKSQNSTASDPNYTLFNAINNWTISGGGVTASGSTAATRNLTCSTAYCHSDGKGSFNTTPDWYGGSFGAGDPCAQCHLNSPTGTSHQPHNVGIHYNNVYTGTVNVVKDASLRQNAHGVAGTSTTISCQLCHNDTIQVKVNAQNTVCVTCHSDTNTPATGNEAASIGNKSKHINGLKDVKFEATAVLSRAQLRESLADAPEVDDNWKRMNGYKVDATSHDHTWDKVGDVERPLDTATMYDPATKNCTVACHNNNQIGWGSTTISCSNCHTQLPK